MLTTETVSRLFSGFDKLNALIIGDVMVDSYIWGKVDRISPEAPVPIVSVENRENRLGGAANVGLNINALGASAILCSVIGKDQKGEEFLGLLENENMSGHGIIQSNQRVTTTKFRVIGNNTQMLRVDEENTNELTTEESKALTERIQSIFSTQRIDVVIFQDYDKGVISSDLIHQVVAMAEETNIPVVVDPKKKNFLNYKHVALFKPNLKEIKEGLNIDFDHEDDNQLNIAISQLQEQIDSEIVLNTLSERGVYIRWNGNSKIIPAHYRNITDVSGAGDTVISVAALCLALAFEPDDMAAIANLAGGLVCEEVGVVPINKNKLQDEVIRLLTQ